jgi:hypothetical protein
MNNLVMQGVFSHKRYVETTDFEAEFYDLDSINETKVVALPDENE